MNKNGLTVSIIFEAESANYGESFGNIATLKKMSRGDGNAYTYISRQALRYNMINQLGWDEKDSLHKDEKEKSVIQFAPEATIDKYKEIDLFGYMKTSTGTGKSKDEKGGSTTRNAVVRLSNAISLESFKAETDFLTNAGFSKRIGKGNNIAQSEIHKSYYSYTITIDLDRIGVDGNINLDSKEKASRVKDFLSIVVMLYRDIRGRRENLSPLFAIGGTYERKNPFFENRLKLEKNVLNINCITSARDICDDVQNNTQVGYVEGAFKNNEEIKSKLNAITIGEFFKNLCKKVDEYYA